MTLWYDTQLLKNYVSIRNHRHLELEPLGDTLECLESVVQIDYLRFDIIIVDNASEDKSIEKIGAYCNNQIDENPLFSLSR